MKKIKTVNPKEFYNKEEDKYIFPIQVLDPDKTCKSLGRIEIHIEQFRSSKKEDGLYCIEKIWLWFQQTRDEKYRGVIFEIPMHCESLQLESENSEGGQTLMFCNIHKNPVIWFYPDNGVQSLEIENRSSIYNRIKLTK